MMHITRKCHGILFIVAGLLLGAAALGYLSLTWFFALLLIIIGVHDLTCKDCQKLECGPGHGHGLLKKLMKK